MKKIPSFTIDHIHLLRGIYVSRKDYLGDHVVTTFDIRMKEPNREPAIGYGALHTIEHLAATFLRNHPVWGDKIVFWGPMGCCTGNYFLMQGDLESKDIVELMRETFRFIRDFDDEVPGAAPRDNRRSSAGLQKTPASESPFPRLLHKQVSTLSARRTAGSRKRNRA